MSNCKILIGLDDTDNFDSPGTGCLARRIAGELANCFIVQGVTRHQLLIDPRVPCTKNNSSAAIHLMTNGISDLPGILEWVKSIMLAGLQPGSDPGLCVSIEGNALKLLAFGRLSQSDIVTQEEARSLAAYNDVHLVGLGGNQDGVIGALAAVGLAACGEDGRYILFSSLRQLEGLQPASILFEAGVSHVCTLDGHPVKEGLVMCDKLRPSRRGGKPVLFVEKENSYWRPFKLDW